MGSEARGRPPDERARLRRERSASLLDDLKHWLGAQLTRISGKTPADAIRYALGRLPKLRPWLDDGRREFDDAERGMRGVAVDRKNWLFAGLEGGGRSAAVAFTLIETAKLDGVDRQAWPPDHLGPIADHKITRIDDLMPLRHAAAPA